MNNIKMPIALDRMNSLIKEVAEVVDQIWLSPNIMEEKIGELLDNIFEIPYQKIIVTGTTKNITVFVVFEDDKILALSPFYDLKENVLLNRWNSSWATDINEALHHYLFEKPTSDFLNQLNMPNMLLINLSVVENFPIPRLNLSIGTLASYIRKQQLAKVTIIDMQMGRSIEKIVSDALSLQPELIGMSVNFGQKEIAFSLLDQLFECKRRGELSSLIVAGNVIPAFNPDQFLEKYPELVICNKEGEYALCDLAKYIKDEKGLENVQGIVYRDPLSGEVKHNQSNTVVYNEVPTPALDTLQEIADHRGALTLESSRGCDYSRCTFCPRDHKLRSWRPLSAENTLEQIDDLIRAGNALGIKPHIYFADEEFIGELPNGQESERVISICEGIMSRSDKIRFDLAARADSVYEDRRGLEWNVERFKMWHYCAQAGTDRVFIGVESGSKKQLKRYGKGTSPEQNIIALRLLSALGIELRIGFIMFDQMMVGLEDIKENMTFLERTDALMKPIDIGDMSYDEVYDRLLNDKEFIDKHKLGAPVYSIVSYMLASMEVLMNAPYARMIQNVERKDQVNLILNEGNPDTNMGRYAIKFYDPLIGELSLAAQKWIDSNFGLMYTTKSLYKVAPPNEKKLLYNYMVKHREISHYLLKYLVNCLEVDTEIDTSLEHFVRSELIIDEILPNGNKPDISGSIAEKIEVYMNNWQKLMERLVDEIHRDLISGELSDSIDNRLNNVIDRWHNRMGHWQLINSFELN